MTSVQHKFFTRRGGVSTGVFSDFNCKGNAGDDATHVTENRKRVTGFFGVTPESLVTLTQTHSAICHSVTSPLLNPLEGDALVTTQTDLVIGVLTADCAPVLFTGSTAEGEPIIGAAHAGWGGAVKGILESTIKAMVDAGANLKKIQAVVGPCIARLSYEVSPEFTAPFLADDAAAEKFFTPLATGKLLFDLPAYVKFRLNRAGVQDVVIDGQDTYRDEENYFSFRRSTHRNEKEYGRQISAICIRKDAS
jgi:hypothetical protein